MVRMQAYDVVFDRLGDESGVKASVVGDSLGRAVLGFFFQAEDGIRDYKVTGVQTCALPISRSSPRRAFSYLDAEHAGDGRASLNERFENALRGLDLAFQPIVRWPEKRLVARSEERRVGKECRSRWSPDH